MRNALFIMMSLVFIAACTTSQPEPTSTPLPPTEPPPPTDTSVPPTKAPNPNAERVLMKLNESVNAQDIEAGKALFAPNAALSIGFGELYEGENAAEEFLKNEINYYGAFWKFSEFNIEGDDVTWDWFVGGGRKNRVCMGNATMQDDLISFLSIKCGSQIN